MNREDPYRQKIDQTRRRIERVMNEETASTKELPPRGELHRHKKKKSNLKVNYPIIRLLVLFFILLPVVIFGIYTYRDGEILHRTKMVVKEKGGYETVDIEKPNVIDPPVEEDSQEEYNALESDKSYDSNAIDTTEVTISPSKATESAGTGDNKNEAANVIFHTVQAGETLYRIAMKYYHSKSGIEIIKNANHLKGNEIRNGQILKIPLKQ